MSYFDSNEFYEQSSHGTAGKRLKIWSEGLRIQILSVMLFSYNSSFLPFST